MSERSVVDAAALLRRSPVADMIRATRLIVVLRQVVPHEHLMALVTELADDGVRVFEVTFDSSTAADDVRDCATLLSERGHSTAIVGAGCVAVGVGGSIVRAPRAERRALIAAIAGGS